MRRFLCLYFPRWPLQQLYQQQPALRGKAVALYERSVRGPRLTACSPEASKLGVARNMLMADATALVPELELVQADPGADRAALEKLALWSERFSPAVGIEVAGVLGGDCVGLPQTIFLDITGCEQLFHGEQTIVRLVRSLLARKGFFVRVAVAPTLGAAWAVSHCGNQGTIVASSDELKEVLAPLPLSALRLDAEALLWLHKLGVHSVGDLARQPRSALPSRFGALIIQRLDQAFGVVPESFVPLRPPPEIHAAHAFEYAVDNLQPLLAVIAQLLQSIVAQLQQRLRGARELECWFYHELSDPLAVKVSLFKSSASHKHLLQLLRTRLEDARLFKGRAKTRGQGPAAGATAPKENVHPESGVISVSLRVLSTEALDSEQLALFSKKLRAPDSLAMTLDRISTRLGPGTVLRPELLADAQPEHACRCRPFVEDVESAPAAPQPRPLQLFPQPLPVWIDWPSESPQPIAFMHNGRHVPVAVARGPERIETGWWKESSYVRRDYYVVESDSGTRYWIFRRLEDERWFVQGVFV